MPLETIEDIRGRFHVQLPKAGNCLEGSRITKLYLLILSAPLKANVNFETRPSSMDYTILLIYGLP